MLFCAILKALEAHVKAWSLVIPAWKLLMQARCLMFCWVFPLTAVVHLALLIFPYIMAMFVVVWMFCNLSRGVVMVCRHCADMDLVGHYLTAISQGILISTNMGCCLGKKHQPLPIRPVWRQNFHYNNSCCIPLYVEIVWFSPHKHKNHHIVICVTQYMLRTSSGSLCCVMVGLAPLFR